MKIPLVSKTMIRVISLFITALILSSCSFYDTEKGDYATYTIDPAEPTEGDSDMEIYDGPCFFDDKNIADFKIVYGECSNKTLLNAAKDLADYLNKAYSSEIPYIQAEDFDGTAENIIFIGSTSYDTDKVRSSCEGLYNNGLAIVCDGSNLYLTGENETGAVYAVYTFLEDYIGWRFYSSSCERLIKQERINLPVDADITYSPKLFNRDTYWLDSFDPHFAAKLKINGGISRNSRQYGQMIRYAGDFVHSLPGLAGTSREPNVQPCLTDPAVYEKVLKKVRSTLKSNPNATIISVSQNDSYADGLGCQCENCRAIDEREGTPMGSLLTFVNKIADAIKDEYPNVYVDTLAYRYTRKAPKTIKPADNVIIRLCSIECCFSHDLDSDCPQNEEFKKDIEDWAKISKNLFVWDYTTDFLYYIIPFPNLKVLYDNVRFFVDHNVTGIFEQGNSQSVSGEFGELRAYMLAKIMWNPDMSERQYERIMDDFLEGYYGAGWQYIKEYINKTSELSAGSHMGIYDSVKQNLSLEGKDILGVIGELEALWRSALEAADEEHYANVERSSLQIRCAKLLLLWD
nr:DUF4838 domain-containing protein [Clostridia bacterium]